MQISCTTVLLATAQVNARSSSGQTYVLTALIDQGSQATLLTERAAQKLRLARTADTLRIQSVGNNKSTSSNGKVNFQLSAMYNNNNNIDINAHVLPSITSYLPAARVSISTTVILPEPLADPSWHTPKAIDILLGADIYCHIITAEMIKLCNNSLLAQRTMFGWILTGTITNAVDMPATQQVQRCQTFLADPGTLSANLLAGDKIELKHESSLRSKVGLPVFRSGSYKTASCNASTLVSQVASCQSSTLALNEISEMLRKFWEISECDDTSQQSAEDAFIEQHFESTHQRDSTGRYSVRLPFKTLMSSSTVSFGDSLTPAIRRLKQVERSLEKKPELREQYIKFMDEYIALGHMTRIPQSELMLSKQDHFYLPHHAVVKDSSSTTKVRVVFDASAKTKSGNSLNNTLLIGPTLQPELAITLLRWRRHKIAFCADVEKMYRQILVHPEDQDFQRIVWRRSPRDPIEHYRLHTVTYGTSAAPYLAVRTLLQLSTDESHQYPAAAQIARSDFYVDDLISGADDVDSALSLQEELITMLNAGGMHLRKWASNSNEVLRSLPESYRECQVPLAMHKNENIKALGITWDPASDCFGFVVPASIKSTSNQTTKRQLLSDASRLFDPLGWLAPTTIIPKLLFQKLWLLKLDWDDQLPARVHTEWQLYIAEIAELETIKISRWTGRSISTSCQLHGFSDASQSAYAAVVYLLIIDSNGQVHITLLSAKTRVAPLTTVTLPRLELCGFTLLANLMRKIINTEFPSTNIETFAWSDSEIVLAWLRSSPSKWKVFVANRTAQIHAALPDTEFHHVKSGDNPADVASRGIRPSKLPSHPLWWSGPQWLQHPRQEWPIQHVATLDTDIEVRAKAAITMTTIIQPFTLIDDCSSLTRLLRVTAYCQRFINNFVSKWSPRHKQSLATAHPSTHLSSLEYHKALVFWIKVAQHCSFAPEINRLQAEEEVMNKSIIISLNPFLDSDGVMRVGGRVRRAAIHYNQRHPIILPKGHRLTTLLVHRVHFQTLHGNTQLMLNTIRQTYWIIHARTVVRKTVSSCKICARQTARPPHQIMADLPGPRVIPARPFVKSAVDYAGPLSLRIAKNRSPASITKGYICIFVCLATKAIHLEAVSDLTTDSFLAAFRRFISRRGHVTDIYSDNGTNFVGAARLLREYYAIAKRSCPQLAAINVNWHFGPPSGPHFNGLAESGVKAMKKHMIRVIGSTILTLLELTTVIVQIEACLNSRPLCRLSDDPSQSEVLTPGHFLIGCAPLAPAEPDYTHIQCLKKRWHHVQQLTQHFWNKWSIEYLHEMQCRTKWSTKTPQPKVGDLVYICDTPSAPLQWPMAIITQLHPGTDDTTRVVTVRTATNDSVKRPIVKLCWLPQTSQKNHHNL